MDLKIFGIRLRLQAFPVSAFIFKIIKYMNKHKAHYFSKLKISSFFVPFLVLAFAFSILSFAPQASAIGQITSLIDIKNALRGQEYRQTLTIVNTEKQDAKVELSAEGDIKDWVEFYKTDDLKNPIEALGMASETTMEIIAQFNIPEDVPNGKYAGYVSVLRKGGTIENKDESSASVSQKIDREVFIEVSDNEIVDIEASIIPNKYDFAKNDFLSLRVVYDNKGNIKVTPQLQLKIKSVPDESAGAEQGNGSANSEKTVYNTIYPYPENQEPVEPLGLREIPPIEIPMATFAKGKYSAEVSVFQGSKSIAEKKFGFSVDMIDELSAVAAANSSADSPKGFLGGKFNISWLGAALAAIAALALIGFLFRRRSRPEDSDDWPFKDNGSIGEIKISPVSPAPYAVGEKAGLSGASFAGKTPSAGQDLWRRAIGKTEKSAVMPRGKTKGLGSIFRKKSTKKRFVKVKNI